MMVFFLKCLGKSLSGFSHILANKIPEGNIAIRDHMGGVPGMDIAFPEFFFLLCWLCHNNIMEEDGCLCLFLFYFSG